MNQKPTVFISWSSSGSSGEIAKILKDWLVAHFSDLDVYFTPEDIGAGQRWSPELADVLQNCHIGIFVYTRENLNNCWMAFEAGALSKMTNEGRVIPILFGPLPHELCSPLRQFQAHSFTKEGFQSACEAINKALGSPQTQADLAHNLRFSWTQLQLEVDEALKSRERKNPEAPDIRTTIENLYSLIRGSPVFNPGFAKDVSELVQQVKTTQKGSYLFIDGQREAFAALIAATMRAKENIRSTRFFPMAIQGNQDNYGEAIRQRVLGDAQLGIQPVKRYTRIIAANNKAKLKDIEVYLETFRGCAFDLYLTRVSNSFELVIIDDDEVFVHFYGEGEVINSTLHIVGTEVTKHFTDIYHRLHDPSHDPDILKIEFKYMREVDIDDWRSRIQKFFDHKDRAP